MNVYLLVAYFFDALKTTRRGSDMAAYRKFVQRIGIFLRDGA